MKKYLLILGIVAVLCIAATKLGEALITNQFEWVVVESCTSSGTEPTDLAVGERTYKTVVAAIAAAASGDDEIEIFRIPQYYNGGIFECIGISDNNSVTHQIYLGTLGNNDDCEIVKAGQLAWTIGTQVSTTSTYELADAVTATAYCWTSSWSSSTPGSELVAQARIDFMGADILVVVTTTSACDSKLLLKGY